MDFFAQQDAARRKTKLLVFYFVLAVVLIVVAIYAVVVALFITVGSEDHQGAAAAWTDWWHPELLLIVSIATLGVIACGSAYKTLELRAGGERVAAMLGGRRIHPNTTDLAERRLLNVVEEMALAAGVPVPPVYVLDREESINAFAAGFTPGDAVIGVNRGTLKYLSRDELQGVMAHEFSHILNGDMRLNLRLIGLLHGILLLAIIGYYLMRSSLYASAGSSSRRDRSGGGYLLILGLAVLVIGSVGLFFARLIKAAVSRQREYLADAAAVQFTRNPGGIAGALKKIGGLLAGSTMKTPEAETASHMFFGSAFQRALFAALATHPPLKERIRRIDPSFDGRFPKTRPLEPAAEPARRAARPARPPVVIGAGRSLPLDPLLVMAAIGTATRDGVQYSADLLQQLPQPLTEAARDLFSARAVVFAMLLDQTGAVRQAQLAQLQRREGEAAAKETLRLQPLVLQAGPEARLPLIGMAQSTLVQLSAEQYDRFRETVNQLVQADKKISLLEFVIQRVLLGRLDRHFGLQKPPRLRHYAVPSVLHDAVALLSILARAGHDDEEQARRAFELGVAQLDVPGRRTTLLAAEACTVERLEQALGQLAQGSPGVKRRVIQAAATCVAADRKVTVTEAELLRAVADALDCPIPPLVARVAARSAAGSDG